VGPPVLEGQLKLADETTELRTADLNGDGLRDVIIGPLVYERLDPVPPAWGALIRSSCKSTGFGPRCVCGPHGAVTVVAVGHRADVYRRR
jgi:hypothetical protein